MTDQLSITFNDGLSIPQVGLGVWQTPNDVAVDAVRTALAAGYRHIDTAAGYQNEEGVGKGLKASGLGREEVFITTKVRNEDQGYDTALAAVANSLKLLDTDYLDLCLIHWPSPWRGKYVETWQALVDLKGQGKIRSIGVSNFEAEHLDAIIAATGETPVLNQIELHPKFQQARMRAVNAERGIATESWSPLGQGKLLEDEAIVAIADKHGRKPAQVIIRWHIENGLIVIPKSVTASRIIDNFDVFGFSLDAEDMAQIAALDSENGRMGGDPMTAKF
jgi:2,5-diketo-D-gluconate reductase A